MEGTTYPRMNRVLLTGIAQEEPELRYTPSGVAVCSFRVQVGRILRDRSGGAREVAAYLTVVAWQEAAQRMARELRKGQAVYVEGYVSSRSFTTARGEKRTAVEIYAEQIQILGPFAEGEKPSEGQPHAEEGQPGAPRGGSRRPARVREERPEGGDEGGGEVGVPLLEEHHEAPHPTDERHHEEPPAPEGAGDEEKLPL